MSFTFRKAKEEELGKIYELFLQVKESLVEEGHFFWSNGYPNKAIFEEDFREGLLYVGLEDDEIVASVGLCPDAIDYFFEGEGKKEKTDKLLQYVDCLGGRSAVVERLMVHPKMQHRGIGTKMMNAFMKESGADHYLLSVFLEDINAINLYKKLGFIDYGNYPYFEWGEHGKLCGLMARKERI